MMQKTLAGFLRGAGRHEEALAILERIARMPGTKEELLDRAKWAADFKKVLDVRKTPPVPAGETPITPAKVDAMDTVYKAMKLTLLKAPPEFIVGATVRIHYNLQNTLDRNLRLPLVPPWKGHVLGMCRHWIERLGDDPTFPGIPAITYRAGKRYAAGSWIAVAPEVVSRGQSIPLFRTMDTKGFPPGRYRYSIDYHDLGGKILQSAAVEFELVPDPDTPAKADTMDTVYKAMKLTPLKVGAGSFKVGAIVRIDYELKNTLDRPLRLPFNAQSKGHVLGIQQTWIERLGDDATIPAKVGRTGRRYAAGGSVMSTAEIVSRGQSLPFTGTVDTKGFPPGQYRYHVDYYDLGSKTLQSVAVEFEIVP